MLKDKYLFILGILMISNIDLSLLLMMNVICINIMIKKENIGLRIFIVSPINLGVLIRIHEESNCIIMLF